MSLSCLNHWYVSLFIFVNFLSPFGHPLFTNALSFGMSELNLDTNSIVFEGDARHSSSMLIELSPSNQLYRVGRCTYAYPLHLWALEDFTTHFAFTVHNYTSTENGGGFAFFLAPFGYPIPPNSAGGSLGLFNTTTNCAVSRNRIVTIEFDSFSNIEWDPPGPHVGINVNEVSSAVNASWDLSSNNGGMANVWITYRASSANLSVSWAYHKNSLGYWNTTRLSYRVALMEILPEWITIGFSAATGLYPEHYTIHSWDFNSNFSSANMDYNNNADDKTFLRAVVGGVSFFTSSLVVSIYWSVARNRRNKIRAQRNQSSVNTDLVRLALPKQFSYQELVAATNGFANHRRLGQGGSGQVFKGFIEELRCTVAVKRIFAKSEHFEKGFVNEVKIISRLRHRSLVQFIGWCHEQGECLLVYPYMPNGSLDMHLFGHGATLQWDFRYKIALGLASALHYLHENAENCVLHRDIKSANVLLDDEFNTKLGDFGISKLVDPEFRTQTTSVVGTFGYIAPEYASGGRASKECDMFSFGVVALEIACGRRAYRDGGLYMSLVSWVWELYISRNLLSAADERLEMNFDPQGMECLLIVGLWCTHPNSKERPKAGQVMKVLQLEAPLPELPPEMHDLPH